MTIKSRKEQAKNNIRFRKSIFLSDYMREIESTDKLPTDNLQPVLLGLFGEVGSIMATAKKHHREKGAYVGYQQDVEEEFGDALWYFTTLCRRLDTRVDSIFSEVVDHDRYSKRIAACDILDGPVSHVSMDSGLPYLDDSLLRLGEATAALLGVTCYEKKTNDLLRSFADRYLQALKAAEVRFSNVVHANLVKARGRFLAPDIARVPMFDNEFPEEERIPRKFEITITQRKSGQCYMQMNDVFIGNPLTDNIMSPDGYRFHDVFHLAHAAVLHWSPTFRALIKRKRKSDPKFDEAEDGGRAIVVEEGLTAWVFSRAKGLKFFAGQDSVSFDLLKSIQQFVGGYEVAACPLKLWEKAILQGYKVFRQVLRNNGGIVIGES